MFTGNRIADEGKSLTRDAGSALGPKWESKSPHGKTREDGEVEKKALGAVCIQYRSYS